VAVRAKQCEVIEPVVAPVAINMFHLDRYSTRNRMAFGPAASVAALAEMLNEIVP
jgi:hypothetical protein